MKPKSVSFENKNLREAVERQLDYDPAVPSNNIGVSVSDGVVSLSGFVDTYADKIFAEKAAKRVRGVKALANDIEVKPPSEHIDPDIAAEAVKSLERNVNVPSVLENHITQSRRWQWPSPKTWPSSCAASMIARRSRAFSFAGSPYLRGSSRAMEKTAA